MGVFKGVLRSLLRYDLRVICLVLSLVGEWLLKSEWFGVFVVKVGYCFICEFNLLRDVEFFFICYSLFWLVWDMIVRVKIGFFFSCVNDMRFVFDGFICEDVMWILIDGKVFGGSRRLGYFLVINFL